MLVVAGFAISKDDSLLGVPNENENAVDVLPNAVLVGIANVPNTLVVVVLVLNGDELLVVISDPIFGAADPNIGALAPNTGFAELLTLKELGLMSPEKSFFVEPPNIFFPVFVPKKLSDLGVPNEGNKDVDSVVV